MNKARLFVLHYSSPPDVGGLELIASQLAAAATRAAHWEGVLVSGTSRGDHEVVGERIIIPQLHTAFPLNRAIHSAFRRGEVHPGLETLVSGIGRAIQAHLRSGDVLVSLNALAVNYNVAVTAALWTLTENRRDIRHIAWCFDVHDGVLPDVVSTDRWPWSLYSRACVGAEYATPTELTRTKLVERLGISKELVRVLPPGTDTFSVLRCSHRVQVFLRRIGYVRRFPVIVVPARVARRKNLDRAVHVAARVREVFPAGCMLIYGAPSVHDEGSFDQREALCRLVHDEGLGEWAYVLSTEPEFSAQIATEDAHSLIGAADVMLLTSSAESFALPVLEAALNGVPAVLPHLTSVMSWASAYVRSYDRAASASDVAAIIADVAAVAGSRAVLRRAYDWDSLFERLVAEPTGGFP